MGHCKHYLPKKVDNFRALCTYFFDNVVNMVMLKQLKRYTHLSLLVPTFSLVKQGCFAFTTAIIYHF